MKIVFLGTLLMRMFFNGCHFCFCFWVVAWQPYKLLAFFCKESQLKKKSNSIAYHYVRERCAGTSPVCSVTYVPSRLNKSDMLTKSQTGPVRKEKAEGVLF